MAQKTPPSISDDAVRKATAKTWAQWFSLLDKAGAKKMDHKQIVAHLDERYDFSGWWKQMVTVSYEQARGLRAKHEKPGGFEISRTKVIGVPIERLYGAWKDKRVRKKWLPDGDFTVRKATPHKSMRITWMDGATHVDAYFYEKGAARSQIAVQHKKLPSAKEADAKKAYWAETLQQLKQVLEA
ncbi:MAG: hypothetical protein ACE10D_04615 [Planctomycetota bacterium]